MDTVFTFKANKKDRDLIDNIAKLHYKQEGLKQLISMNTNPSAIETLADKYSETFSECEKLKNILRYNMIKDCNFVIDYNISFMAYTVTFMIHGSADEIDYMENSYHNYINSNEE